MCNPKFVYNVPRMPEKYNFVNLKLFVMSDNMPQQEQCCLDIPLKKCGNLLLQTLALSWRNNCTAAFHVDLRIT